QSHALCSSHYTAFPVCSGFLKPQQTRSRAVINKHHQCVRGCSVLTKRFVKSPTALENNSWQALHSCHNCSLFLSNNSIHCTQDGLYFLYAQVTFTRHTSEHQSKYVTLKKNPNLTKGKKLKKLAEGSFPSSTEGSVWVAKIVRLREGDSVSLDIKDEILKESTFWGAYELH
uniref:THD domain-containing protein n=1 Tax=Mastacembelus armatus TaxID=205130 RepID=A0A3Q3LKV2_9TELE